MRNQDIRLAAKVAGVKLWQIAEEMGVGCSWFSVRLRKELPQEEKERIFTIIKNLKEART